MSSKTRIQIWLYRDRFIRGMKLFVVAVAALLILSPLGVVLAKGTQLHTDKITKLGKGIVKNFRNIKNTKIYQVKTYPSRAIKSNKFASILSNWESKGFLPGFHVYTNYNGTIKRTKLILGLRKPIDVDNDGKSDIRVQLKIRPKIVMDPLPSFALSLRLFVTRLNDKIKYHSLEVAGEVSLPRILGGDSIRFGYFSKEGQEIPKTCQISYLYVPHLLKIRKKPAGGIEFLPKSSSNSSITLLATIEKPSGNRTTLGIEYAPMVHTVVEWERTRRIGKWRFSVARKLPSIKETTATLFIKSSGTYAGIVIDKLSSASFEIEFRPLSKKGGYIHYIKENLKASDVSLFIQTVNITGALSIRNLPAELEASWLLRPEGFVKINTHDGTVGQVEAKVKGVSTLKFDPKTDINLKIEWRNITKNSFNLDIDSKVSAAIENIYLYSLVFNNSTGTYDTHPLIDNGDLNLLGCFGLKTHLILPEIKKGIVMNSTVKIIVNNASLKFKADNLAGMGNADLSLHNTGLSEIDLLNFTMDNSSQLSEEELKQLPDNYLIQPWQYAPWMNGSVFIDTHDGQLSLDLLDIESFGDFGHTVIKNLIGEGQTNVEFHLISMYMANPFIVTNAPGTSITLQQFSFRFFGMPITIYDAKLVEGVFNFYFEMWIDHWITAEIRNGSGIERAGVSIEPLGVLGSPELDQMGLKLNFYWSEPIKYLYFDWYVHDWYNASITGAPLFNSFVIDTNGIDTHLDMYFTAFDRFGIKFDNLTLNSQDTNFTINFEGTDFTDPSSIIDAITRTTLIGNLTILNLGKTIELMVNGTWYPLLQFGNGYNIKVEHGHIQIAGGKRFIINESVLIPGTDLEVKLAGDFSFGSEAGAIDIWLNRTKIKISGDTNFTVKNFHLSVGENFSMGADLFMFNLGAEANGSIEIGPTPSGSGKITLTKANILLRNCTIIYRGPIPIPNTKPTVDILSPSDGSEVGGLLIIRGNATDSDGYVTLVQVSIDDGPWQNATYSDETGEWRYDIDTTTLPNGIYRIKARSFDGIDYSDISSINVTINNTGANWRPTVDIIYPSDGGKVNGTVTIQGTAKDRDGSVVLVQVSIDDGPWQNATGITSWSYEWNTTGLIGKHMIKARSIDDKDCPSSIKSIEVSTKVSLKAEGAVILSLIDASIDVENMVIEVKITGAVILASGNPAIKVEIGKFSLGGVGNVSVKLSSDGIDIGTGGIGKGVFSELDMGLNATIPTDGGDTRVDTILYVYGRATGPLNFHYNSTGFMLGGDFESDVRLKIDINEISGVINSTPISVEAHIDSCINTSAHGVIIIKWNDTGLQSINADFNSKIDGYVKLYNLHIIAGGYGANLDDFTIIGNGQLYVKNGTFSFKGRLREANIKNLYMRLPGQNISLSGGLSTSRQTNLSVIINGTKDFAISSDGRFNITDLRLSVGTDNLTTSISLRRLELETDGHLRFRYIENNLNITCRIYAHKIYAEDVNLVYGNQSLHLNAIDFEGTLDYNLNSPLYIEQGDDYIKITICEAGKSVLDIATNLEINGKEFGMYGHIEFKNAGDKFVILIGNLSGNATLNINGSAIAYIENFHFWYGDTVDIEIPYLSIGFTLSTYKKEGTLSIVGITSTDIDAEMSVDKENFSISGHFSLEGNLEGNITISWNKSGITRIGGDVEGKANLSVQIENFKIRYGNFTLSSEILYINGSMNLTLESHGNTLTLYMQPSGELTVHNMNVKVGFYEGSFAIFGTITTNATISVTLYFSGATSSMLSSNEDTKRIGAFLQSPFENLYRYMWGW